MRLRVLAASGSMAVAAGLVLVAQPASAAPSSGFPPCTTTKPFYWDGSDDSFSAWLPSTIFNVANGCLLSNGAKDNKQGSPVSELQWELNKCNGAKLTIDGGYTVNVRG